MPNIEEKQISVALREKLKAVDTQQNSLLKQLGLATAKYEQERTQLAQAAYNCDLQRGALIDSAADALELAAADGWRFDVADFTFKREARGDIPPAG